MIYNIYRILSKEEWNGQNFVNQFEEVEFIKSTTDKNEAHSFNMEEDIFVEIEDI